MARIDWPDQIDRLNQGAAWIGRWSILLMLVVGAWNVVGRYLGLALGMSLSSNALIEAQWALFSVAFLLGLGYTLNATAMSGRCTPQPLVGPQATAD